LVRDADRLASFISRTKRRKKERAIKNRKRPKNIFWISIIIFKNQIGIGRVLLGGKTPVVKHALAAKGGGKKAQKRKIRGINQDDLESTLGKKNSGPIDDRGVEKTHQSWEKSQQLSRRGTEVQKILKFSQIGRRSNGAKGGGRKDFHRRGEKSKIHSHKS